jgi:hypothetical protein
MRDEYPDTEPAQTKQDRDELLAPTAELLSVELLSEKRRLQDEIELLNNRLKHAAFLLEDALRFIHDASSAFAQLPMHFKESVPDYVKESYNQHRIEANKLCKELPRRFNESYFN